MNDLNVQQKQAVDKVNGRVLILAGAGTGKTKVLTMRMAHLINHHNVSPKSILGLTFTNKAAAEMRHRIGQLVSLSAAKQITLSTFHSFCMQILRTEIHHLGYTSNFTLYNEKDIQRIVGMIARDITGMEKDLPSLSATMSAIANAKYKGYKGEEIKDTGSQWHDQFSQTVYQRLNESLKAYNAVDFDHLLWLTVELFEKHPTILEKYQERFRYIMIDEYQDTNPIQYRLAELLASKYGNVCVVGDDDQSIYGWRGAEVKNILEFESACTIKLEQNYRSTNNILRAANHVINKNSERHQKVLWSNNGDGELINIFTAPKESDEAEVVAYRIAKYKQAYGLKWKDIAILYRSNTLSRPFETALLKHRWFNGKEWEQGIPYQVIGGTEFYERREIKDLAAYLRIIVNPKDQEAILRVINVPRRGIGEAALNLLTAYNRKHGISLWDVIKEVALNGEATDILSEKITGKSLLGIQGFYKTIEEAKGKFSSEPLFDALNWLVESVHFKKSIFEEVKSDQMREFKWENVQEFIGTVKELKLETEENESGDGLHPLTHFLSTITLDDSWQGRKRSDQQTDKVNLLTFHSAKGLEFPVCFLVCMEDHLIPHEKSMKETGIQEERRLMYVALTRAMRHLTISMAEKRSRMGKESKSAPSRFLYDIPSELLQITKWDQI